MTPNDKETLSQLMDGEWHELDAAQCVKAACSDQAQKETWARYHIVRDVIRNDGIRVDGALTARIHDAIADEPSYSNVSSIHGDTSLNDTPNRIQAEQVASAPKGGNKTQARWGTAFGGFAIAASVALATVVGLNLWQGAPDGGQNRSALVASATGADNNAQAISSVQSVVPGVAVPQLEFVSNRGTYWVTPEAKRSPAMEKRLNSFLSQHIENSPTAERSGMLPYSRLVGYDSVTTTEQ